MSVTKSEIKTRFQKAADVAPLKASKEVLNVNVSSAKTFVCRFDHLKLVLHDRRLKYFCTYIRKNL